MESMPVMPATHAPRRATRTPATLPGTSRTDYNARIKRLGFTVYRVAELAGLSPWIMARNAAGQRPLSAAEAARVELVLTTLERAAAELRASLQVAS